MGVYSNITLNEVNEILKHYHVDRAVDFYATTQGISNSNFKVTLNSGDHLLLKISNDKTIEQLENEQRILLTLKKYNYSFAIPPLETIKGTPIYTHGDFYGVVFHFVQGLPPIIDQSSTNQIGSALAKLHSIQIHKEDLASIRLHEVVGHNGLSIAEFCQSSTCPDDFRQAYYELFPSGLVDLPYSLFPAGIIHGDLYYDNSLFDQGHLITLIDFEQAGIGRFILDLGIAVSGSCLSGDDVDPLLFKAFLEGYESVRVLTHLEREYLHTAIVIGFLSIALWRIDRFYEGKLDHSKKFNYRELLTRALKFKKNFGLD